MNCRKRWNRKSWDLTAFTRCWHHSMMSTMRLLHWTHGLSGVEKRFPSSSSDIESFGHASRGTTPECLLKPTLPLSQSIAGIRDHSEQFKVTSANIKSPASKDLEFTSTALKEPEVTTTNIRRSPVPYGSGGDGSHSEELGVTTTNIRRSPVPYGSGGDGSHSKELGVATTPSPGRLQCQKWKGWERRKGKGGRFPYKEFLARRMPSVQKLCGYTPMSCAFLLRLVVCNRFSKFASQHPKK